MAYEVGDIDLHARIKIRMEGELVETTSGRVIMNEVIPSALGYINRVMDKKQLGALVYNCYRRLGNEATAEMLDGIKTLGYNYATKAGITVGISDFETPAAKQKILQDAEARVDEIEEDYQAGLITEEERHELVVDVWDQATDR